MQQQLTTYIKSGIGCIHLETTEEERATSLIRHVAKKELVTPKKPDGYAVWTWTVSNGLMDEEGKMVKMRVKRPDGEKLESDDQKKSMDPVTMLNAFLNGNVEKRSLVILLDFHMYLRNANPMLYRLLKEAAWKGRRNNQHLIIVGCSVTMPAELEKEIKVLSLPLPNREELKEVAVAIAESMPKKKSAAATAEDPLGVEKPNPLGDNETAVLDALSGLTTNEAGDAISISLTSKKVIDPVLLHSIKTDTIRRNGVVDVVESMEDMANIAGMGLAKSWLAKRARIFSKEAKEFGLDNPKGVMLIGISGTGKSLLAKAVAAMLKLAMLRLEGGKIFGSHVGDSERNMRTALRTAEAMAPCVFFVDELEKAIGGSQSSGQCDGGTTARVVGTFLQWMQDKTAPVFVVATANDVSQLPPETLRRGRFDQIFFVDLPDLEEREAAWKIHITRIGRKPKDYDLKALAAATAGFTGAEIQSIVSDGLVNAYAENIEPNTETFTNAIKETVPLSSTMKEKIAHLRKWANGRALHASGKPYDTDPIAAVAAAK